MKKLCCLLAFTVAASLSCGAPLPDELPEPGPEIAEPVNLWPADADLGVVIPSGVDPFANRPPPPPVRE